MSIQVKNLNYTYSRGTPNETKALDNINFNIYDGEIIGIIGHTGSGKSTLLQQLNGLLKADEGSIEIDGEDILSDKVSMRDIRRKVGLVFQYPEYQLFEETVEKDVAFGPKNLGLDGKEVELRVREALELVGLDYEKVKGLSPFDLSGGQKRRVAIAGVIAMKPKVLILDEPTAGLDPGAHKEILAMIEKIHNREENIIIFVSHNMKDVANISHRVMVMDKGKLIMMGSPEEIFSMKERLNTIGLDAPPITDLMYKLEKEGIGIEKNIFNIKKAEEEIYRYLTEVRP